MLCCAAQGFNTIAIDTWLEVIPQIIARIHTQSPQIRRLIHELLVRVGREHPQVRATLHARRLPQSVCALRLAVWTGADLLPDGRVEVSVRRAQGSRALDHEPT